MASIEYIQKRITGKEKELEKLNKKLERIKEAQSANWEKNPYYYHESDLKWCLRDIEKAETALAQYRADLEIATEKANSRNVEVILQFLARWKAENMEWYQEQFVKFLKELEKRNQENYDYCEWLNHGGWRKVSKEEAKEIEKKEREAEKRFNSKWGFIAPYITRIYNPETQRYERQLDLEKLDKDFTEEANRKYDFIIEKTNAIVGTITDASGLLIGAKGDLNGYIVGPKGTAHVQTIGAGGYNIQRFHFRTLINPMK